MIPAKYPFKRADPYITWKSISLIMKKTIIKRACIHTHVCTLCKQKFNSLQFPENRSALHKKTLQSSKIALHYQAESCLYLMLFTQHEQSIILLHYAGKRIECTLNKILRTDHCTLWVAPKTVKQYRN